MLEVPNRDIAQRQRGAVSYADEANFDLGALVRSVLGGLRRQWRVIALSVLGLGLLATAYVLIAPARYTATASIIIDPRANNGPDAPSAQMLLMSDALVVDSEVQVLLSPELADRVITQLKLMDNPEILPEDSQVGIFFAGVRQRIGQTIARIKGADEPKPEAVAQTTDRSPSLQRKRDELRRAMANQLSVERNGETYVINTSYTAASPDFAAKVANAFVDQYFLTQAEAVYDNTRRVSDWLSQRVAVLAENVKTADNAVETFKRNNNLFNVQNDQLPSAVEFAAANEQLVSIRNDVVSVSAKIDQLNAIIDNGSISASIDPEVRTTALTNLQSRYSDLVGRERDLSSRFGANHLLAQRARSDIAQTRDQIFDEFRKIVISLRNQLAVLRQREAENGARVEQLRVLSAADSQKMIRMRELDREATASRTLYETLLGKLNETNQQQTFQSAPARVIAKAVPPTKKSAPRSKLVVALALFGGLVVGSGIAFLREQIDDMLRTGADLEDALGLSLLGIVPFHRSDRKAQRSSRDPKAAGGERRFRRAELVRFATDNPNSRFAATMRSVSLAVTQYAQEGVGTAVGFTSVRHGEGKTTLAGNFATHMASLGSRVVLIDFDLTQPALTRFMLDQDGEQITVNRVLLQPALLAELRKNAVLDGGSFVGNEGTQTAVGFAADASVRMLEEIVRRLRGAYDYIVLDLPPMGNSIEIRVASNVADSVILAAEWGKTHRNQLRQVSQHQEQLLSKLHGAVFTKVDLAAYGKYDARAAKDDR